VILDRKQIEDEQELVEQELARLDPPVVEAAEHIRAKIHQLHPERDAEGKWRVSEGSFGMLSTGERIAAAMVLDRYDLIRSYWGTMLEAIDRLGNEWTMAALRVQRNGWDTPTS
jgi:hypothetical protein